MAAGAAFVIGVRFSVVGAIAAGMATLYAAQYLLG